jgi:hypothetical protein
MLDSQAVLAGTTHANPEAASAVGDRLNARRAIREDQRDLGTGDTHAFLILDNATDDDLSSRGRRSTKQTDEQDLGKRQAPDLQKNVPVAIKA